MAQHQGAQHIAFIGDFANMDFTRFRRHKSTSSSKLLEWQRALMASVTAPVDSIVETIDANKYGARRSHRRPADAISPLDSPRADQFS
jgi:hypothetical protein